MYRTVPSRIIITFDSSDQHRSECSSARARGAARGGWLLLDRSCGCSLDRLAMRRRQIAAYGCSSRWMRARDWMQWGNQRSLAYAAGWRRCTARLYMTKTAKRRELEKLAGPLSKTLPRSGGPGSSQSRDLLFAFPLPPHGTPIVNTDGPQAGKLEFRAGAVVDVCWLHAKLGGPLAQCPARTAHLVEVASYVLDQLQPRQLAVLAWAFSKLHSAQLQVPRRGSTHGGLQETQTVIRSLEQRVEGPVEQLMFKIADRLCGSCGTLPPLAVAQTFGAFARTSVRHDRLLQRLCIRAFAVAPRLSLDSAVEICWSLAFLGCTSSEKDAFAVRLLEVLTDPADWSAVQFDSHSKKWTLNMPAHRSVNGDMSAKQRDTSQLRFDSELEAVRAYKMHAGCQRMVYRSHPGTLARWGWSLAVGQQLNARRAEWLWMRLSAFAPELLQGFTMLENAWKKDHEFTTGHKQHHEWVILFCQLHQVFTELKLGNTDDHSSPSSDRYYSLSGQLAVPVPKSLGWLEAASRAVFVHQNLSSSSESDRSWLQRQVQSAAEKLYGADLVHPELLLPATGLAIDIAVLGSDSTDQYEAGRPDLAIEVDGPSHFLLHCRGGGVSLQSVHSVSTGATEMKRRQLRQLGWEVQSIPYYEWQSLGGDGGAELRYLDAWDNPVEQQREVIASLDATLHSYQTQGHSKRGRRRRRKANGAKKSKRMR
eukprot:SAG31_NODE_552_length_14204_cov_14.295356_10_plen_706_part_00